MITLLDESNFNDEINKPSVLVEFGADWCAPCKVMLKLMTEMQTKYPEHHFCRVDVDNTPELAAQYKIRAVPTLISFKNGLFHKTHSGTLPENRLLELLSDEHS